MKEVELNGVQINDSMLEKLKALQAGNNTFLDGHIKMLIEAGDFLVENSYNFQNQEKELLSHVQSLMLVRDVLKSLRKQDLDSEMETGS